MSLLSDIGILGGCLFAACIACLIILACLMVAGDLRHRRQQKRYTATQPNRVIAPKGEVGDDTLRMLAEHRRFDDDTFHWDGLGDELRRMTEGDGRG